MKRAAKVKTKASATPKSKSKSNGAAPLSVET